MFLPLLVFTGSGIVLIIIAVGTYLRMRKGMPAERTGVVSKVDQVIGSKTTTIHHVLVAFSGDTIRGMLKRALRVALLVILHTLHELHDLTRTFLDKMRKAEIKDKIEKMRGEPSQFLRNVSDRK